jgi:subfamily B ATP-binding cassette protein MsbA
MFAEFKPLFPHLKPLRGKFILGFSAAILFGVSSGAGLPLLAQTVLPLIFQDEERLAKVSPAFLNFVYAVFGREPERILFASCLFVPLIFVLRGLGGYLSAFWMNEVGMRTIETFRNEVFAKLMMLPIGFHGTRSSGDLLSRVIGDTSAMQNAVVRSGGTIIKQPIVLISVLVFLVSEALTKDGVFFALIGGISIPLLVFPIRSLGKRLKRRGALMRAKAGEMTGMVSEAIQNPLEVRAYNLQGKMSGDFNQLSASWRKIELKMVRYRQILGPLVEVVAAVGFSVALYLGARQNMSLEDFLGVATALFIAYEPVKKLGALHGSLEQAKAAMARVVTILEADDDLPDATAPEKPVQTRGEVVFENVRFAYGEEEVLKGVNVRVEPGETVALVGESGGGKTTFANLIPRFYDVSSGSILIDDLDVRQYEKADLRSRVALVPQMPVLFRGTILENILVGKPSATKEEVEEAARKAFAHDFILKQENGYETAVSEKGSSLSGGQRQRIAIARAFLKDAPILILDEATSALDSESEAKVQGALEQLTKGRTTLMITHRESSRSMASRVLQFTKGVVNEE